jgi:transcriptional regulator with XRE-family HTH domain
VDLPAKGFLPEIVTQEDGFQCLAQFAQRPVGRVLHVVLCEAPKDGFGFKVIIRVRGRLRKARGMTQIQLAKAAKTTQRAISYYENEAGFPPAPAVIALAGALHVTADELLGIKPQPREASKFEQVTSDPESMRLWKRFQRITLLPERDQRAFIRLIKSLTGATGAETHD